MARVSLQRSCRRSLIGALLLAVAGGAAAAPGDVVSVELPDQYGRIDSLAAHAGEIVLVFVVTANAMLNTKFWEEDLREQVDGVTYLRVADVPDDPNANVERIASRLLVVVPSSVPVMIDEERRWATALDLDTSEPNLLLYTRNGLLGARFRGRWHPNSVPDVVTRLRQLQDLP